VQQLQGRSHSEPCHMSAAVTVAVATNRRDNRVV